jgi:hypothetical protein
MNKTAIGIAAIIAAAAVVGFYIWSTHNRYYIITSSNGIAYEVDRKTGKSWVLFGGRKIEQESPDTQDRPEHPLPLAEKEKITGTAGLGFDETFSGKIYNGSSWVVTRAVMNVTAKEEDGSVRWSRDFSADLKIKPLETASFSVAVTGERGIKLATWNIKEIYGYQK